MSSVRSPLWFDPHPGPAPPSLPVARVMLGFFMAFFAVNVGWIVALVYGAASGAASWQLVRMFGWLPVVLATGSLLGARCAIGAIRDGRCGLDPRG